MPGETESEVLLLGGTANRGQVVRVGDTVRRPQRATSPATHALLRHLADVGFDGAPRFLSVAHLLRDYHRAVSSFSPAPHPWPPSPPPPFAGQLVSHNDVNLDNVVFRDGRAVALIDFDLASPGCRVWDVACATRLWAPLRPDRYIDDSRRGRALHRLRLFVDSYGLDRGEREALVPAVLHNHQWLYDIVGTAAANGHPAFSEYLAGGAMRRAERTRRWYLDNADVLRQALV
jgi:hypothetical protein